MSKHTPTPWHLYHSPHDGRTYVLSSEYSKDAPYRGETIAYGTHCADSDANMEFIVRAANAHDDLLAACKQVVGLLEAMHEVPPTRAKALRAAINKAEGRSVTQ